jgi:hypothetical protein
VGATTLFYSGVAFWVIGFDAIQPVGIIFAWGIACFLRWGQLQALIVDAVYRIEHPDTPAQALDRAIDNESRG